MIPVTVTIRERGPVRRGLKKKHRQASKYAWAQAAEWFVIMYADRRFSAAHARRAGYKPRKRGYEARKLKRWGHTRPLEFSGRARMQSRTFRVVSFAEGGGKFTGAKVRYPGLQVFNFKPPNSDINMREEWMQLLPEELQRVGEKYDRVYDQEFNGGQQDLFTETVE